jgi:hypothetical protein
MVVVVGVVGVAAIALLVVAVTRSNDDKTEVPAGPRTVEFVVPAGTGDRIDRGETVDDVFPGFLQLNVGDSIRIDNRDDRVHTVGPLSVRAGEVVTYTFDKPGGYRGECTLHSAGSTEILVL